MKFLSYISVFLLLAAPEMLHAYEAGDVLRPKINRRSRLLMRTNGSQSAGVARRLRSTDEITVIGDNQNSNYIRVRLSNGQTGYVARDYTRIVRSAPKFNPNATYTLGNVNQWASLLPSARSNYGQRIAKIDKGTELKAIETDPNSGRVKVQYRSNGQNRQGWVDASRLKKSFVPMEKPKTYQLGNVNQWASLLPSANSSYRQRLARIKKGQKLTAIGKDPKTGRVKVRYNVDGKDYEGWVDNNRLEEPVAAEQSVAAATPQEPVASGNAEPAASPIPLPVQAPPPVAGATPSNESVAPSTGSGGETTSNVPPPIPEAKPEGFERVKTDPNDDSPLDYAKALTECARYGIRMSGRGLCAKGVRHALACAGRKTGIRDLKGIHCGVSAIDYAGRGCLEKRGFRNDMSKCNKPGVVRVYDGICSKRRGGRCKKGYRRKYSGDYHGHIEFLGTDRKWHSFYSSRHAIDSPRKFGKRRRLVACYVR